MKHSRKSIVILSVLVLSLSECSSGDPDRGKLLYNSRGCAYCHAIGKKGRQGPDLGGVGSKYEKAHLEKWLLDPEIIYKETGKRPINKNYPPMPRIQLTEEERRHLVAFLKTLKRK